MSIETNIANLFNRPLERMKPLEALRDAIVTNNQAFISINHEQLLEGDDVNGNGFKPYANYQYTERETYAEYKNRKNTRAGLGNPDLRNTGAFFRGFFLTVTDKETRIDSKDSKAAQLEKWYGQEVIYGIAKKNIQRLGNFLKPQLQNNIRKQIGIR